MPKQQAQQIIGGSNGDPGIETLKRLAAALGVNMAWLFEED